MWLLEPFSEFNKDLAIYSIISLLATFSALVLLKWIVIVLDTWRQGDVTDIASSALGGGGVKSQVARHAPGKPKFFPHRVLKVEVTVTIQAQCDVSVNLKIKGSSGGRMNIVQIQSTTSITEFFVVGKMSVILVGFVILVGQILHCKRGSNRD